MNRPEAERREQIARALLIADDGGNADAILAATEHAGDCPFVAVPAAYTCSLCQADHYRTLADAVLALPADDGWRPIDDEMVDAGAQALRQKMQGHKRLNEWTLTPRATKARWRAISRLVLEAATSPPDNGGRG